MPSQPTSPLTTLYRLAIMGGTLACGSMAAFRYGPEADQLAEMIDGVAAMVVEVAEPSDEPTDALQEPAPFASTGERALAPETLAEEPPRFDAAVSPASAVEPIARERTPAAGQQVDPLEQARLTAPLFTAGATRAAVEPWGAGQQAMYRATAAVPAGGEATGLERQFDALGETPEAAVASLEIEVREAGFR